jgi:hypothetical protein
MRQKIEIFKKLKQASKEYNMEQRLIRMIRPMLRLRESKEMITNFFEEQRFDQKQIISIMLFFAYYSDEEIISKIIEAFKEEYGGYTSTLEKNYKEQWKPLEMQRLVDVESEDHYYHNNFIKNRAKRRLDLLIELFEPYSKTNPKGAFLDLFWRNCIDNNKESNITYVVNEFVKE